jgi:hypothetical protein
MRPLLIMLALIAATAAFFSAVSDPVEDVTDPLTLGYIAVIYTLAIVVMLIFTRRWNTIGLGLLATMTGDALLYGRASEHLPMPDGAWVLDIARAAFIVGATYLAIGIAMWVLTRRRAASVEIEGGTR